MLLASGDPTLLVTVLCLLVVGLDIALRWTGLSAYRDRLVRNTHRLAVVLGLLVAAGFFITLEKASTGDIVGALLLGMVVGAVLWPVCYLTVVLAFMLLAAIYSLFGKPVTGWITRQRNARKRRADDIRQAAAQRRHAARQAEADELRRQEAATRAADSKLRADARLACQLYLDQHAGELSPTFDQDRLDAYFSIYLGDDKEVEQVVERAGQLMVMLREIVDAAGPKQQFTSLADIAAHFQQQRDEVESETGYDKDVKESFLCALNAQEETAIREFLTQ